MVYLYPRLLPAAASHLREEYLQRSVEYLCERSALSHPAMFYAATGGARLPEQRLGSLREAVLACAAERGYPAKPGRKQAAGFDIEVATILHRDSGIVPAEAVAGDLWAFLSLVVLPDVSLWRFTDLHHDRVLGTDVTRHVFGRLWWRAHLLYDEDGGREDLYASLSVLNESAFDQIYARRTSIGGSPHLVRAIVRVWQTLDVPPQAERKVLRDFLIRVLRLNAFISFDTLPADVLDEELMGVFQESLSVVVGV
ncbi:DUF6339 family protein [Streptomyces sp. RS10V-4]|uniref:DUF6339 family protein n=1 Tax=Streptomyces rhizoryzae TaxID=2932493 RepID=UPI002005F8FA|nr:DUF6339 family protein [Streptomyces rhizoryzae]MCK7627462.1 DUF6339 family protein [Streptomyces rhizoryzae]